MKEQGISCSNTHLKVFSNEYPIEDIERATIIGHHTSYRGPFFLLIMGILFALGHVLTGILIALGAVIWGLTIKKKYSLILTIKGIEKSVLIHSDKKLLEDLLLGIQKLKEKERN